MFEYKIITYIIYMLSNTKNSGLNQTRKSAKLPKLTIQQQIENQQVIERMNRKITFAKNPRHLTKTIPFNQAFQTTNNGSIFRVEPELLYFTNFEINKIYESEVKLVNRSKYIQRIKITPLQKKQFVVSNVKYPNQQSGDIAPGMQVSIFVRFKPTNLHDIQDQLIVIVGNGVIKVPIRAERQKCRGEWPKEVNCGHCWLGDQISKEVTIPNLGGDAVFTLQDAAEKIKTIGAFKVWPNQLKLQKNKKNSFMINFVPKQQGIFEQKITYVSNQGNEERFTIKIKGGAYSAQITLDEINNQKVMVKKFQNCMYLSKCEPGRQSSSTFKINNHAVVPVDYYWYYQSQPNFTISPQKGKIAPSQVLNFAATYLPTNRHPKTINAQLYLYDLPKQSIINNPISRIINGKQMIQCLKLEVKITSTQSNIEVAPLHKVISQKIFVGKEKRVNFVITNNSKAQRKFWVQKLKDELFCSSRCETEGQIILKPQQSVEVWFSFVFKQLKKQVQKSYYLVHFDNVPSKMISFGGQVQFPDLQLYSSHVQFQLLRTHSNYKKIFKIANTDENQVQFKIQNPYKFYDLDFYDLYEFENQDYYYRKLNILCGGVDVYDWMLIEPGCQKVLQFQYNTKQPEIIDLDLKIIIKNGNQYNIKVTGEVQRAAAKISQSFIPTKQIFQGNTYSSTKLLPKQLSIDNISNLPIRYEIIPPEIEECSITISQLTGIINPRTKKIIQMVLEPLKTGTFASEFKICYYDDIALFPQRYEQQNEIIEFSSNQRKNLIGEDSLRVQGRIRGVETTYYLKDQTRAKRVAQKMNVQDTHLSARMSSYSHKSASKSHYLDNFKLVYPILEQLNFYNCEINKVQQLQILIQNNSQLTTQYEIYAQNYRSIEKALSETKSQAKGMMQGEELAFTSAMGKTYIENRALNQAQKIYLSNNKGVSITCEPSAGVLHKRQLQKIIITMFNDASGRFKDNLVISIKDHEIKKFPINIQIKGTPVSLSRNQLGINFNNEIPLLNTGTFLKKNGKSSRNIKIINNGPREVQLKWLLYPYGPSNEQNIFDIGFNAAEPGSGNIVELNWSAIKPQPLANSPFSITPSNKTLKGREEANFVLTIQERDSSENLQVLVIGQPVMLEQSGKVPMQDLAIVVQAQIVSPVLKLDQQHVNQIHKLQKFAVIGNQQRTQARNNILKIKLKNNFRCNISFNVQIATEKSKFEHFEIVSTCTDSPVAKLKPKILTSTLSKTKTVVPVEVDKQFTLPYESYVEVGIQLKADPKNIQQWPLQSILRKDGWLIVNFANGQKQMLPLVGWLYRPSLQIQMPDNSLHSQQNLLIDFGVVHVNNYKKQSIYLSNPTKSAVDWAIAYTKYQQGKKIAFQKELWTDLDYEDQNIVDEKKCFRLNQDSGHLLAESIPTHYIPGTLALNSTDDKYAETHKPFKLDFVFKPQTKALYKSRFIIKVEHGPSYEIIVRGRGVFDQEAQIK